MISEKKKKNIEENEVIKPPAENFFYNPTENFFSFSFLRSIKPPPPVKPTTTTAHKRPTSLATPRRRDPPRWSHREARIHYRSHKACRQALPCRSQRFGGGGALRISPWRSRSRPGGGGAIMVGWFTVVCGGGFWLLWVDLRWLWWWRVGRICYCSWLFFVGNNNKEE